MWLIMESGETRSKLMCSGAVMVIMGNGKRQVLVYSIDTRLYSVTLAINILYEGANVALFVGVYVQKNKGARGDFLW